MTIGRDETAVLTAMGASVNAFANRATALIETQQMAELLMLIVVHKSMLDSITPMIGGLVESDSLTDEVLVRLSAEAHATLSEPSIAVLKAAGLNPELLDRLINP